MRCGRLHLSLATNACVRAILKSEARLWNSPQAVRLARWVPGSGLPIPFGTGPGTNSYFVRQNKNAGFLQYSVVSLSAYGKASEEMAGQGARDRILDCDLCGGRFLCRWPSQSAGLPFRLEEKLRAEYAKQAPWPESNPRTFKSSTDGGFSGGLQTSIGLND